VIQGVGPGKGIAAAAPSTGVRIMTDTIVVPSVIDLVMAAARFVAVLATVPPYLAEEADVLFPTATVAVGDADKVP